MNVWRLGGNIMRAGGGSLWKQVSAGTFDYYIGPSGSDGNAGTIGSPWAITSLLSSQSSSYGSQIATNKGLMAGKRVGLLDGTYRVAAYAAGFGDSDHVVLDIPSGSSGTPTIIEAVNARLAIIEGVDSGGTNRVNTYYSNGCAVIGQTYLTSGTGNVTLKNLVIRKGYRYLVHWRYNISLIQAYTTDGLTVKNCKLYNARGESGSASNGYCIQTWSCDNSVYEYNEILDAHAGIYVKNLYQSGVTIRYNYINLTDYTGGGSINGVFGCDYGDTGVQHVSCHHNVIVAQNPIRIHDLGNGLAGPSQFYNNTLVAIGSDFGVCGAQVYGDGNAIDFYNNIVYHSGSSANEEGDLVMTTTNTGILNYNRYPATPKFGRCASGSYYPTTTTASLATWAAAMSTTDGDEAGSSVGDPTFAATGSKAAYYQLGGGSACINGGKSNGLSGGSTVDQGAWGNSAPATIGCDF